MAEPHLSYYRVVNLSSCIENKEVEVHVALDVTSPFSKPCVPPCKRSFLFSKATFQRPCAQNN
jgi:hypothetical protein